MLCNVEERWAHTAESENMKSKVGMIMLRFSVRAKVLLSLKRLITLVYWKGAKNEKNIQLSETTRNKS